MTLIDALLLLLIPAGLSLVLTPVAITLARLTGAIDRPNPRKVHRQPTPRLGGIAIAVSFLFTLWVGWQLAPALDTLHGHDTMSWVVVTAGLLVMLALGVIDDVKNLGAGKKFLVQLVVATAVSLLGVRFDHIAFFGSVINLGWISHPLTVLWIVGITNAINLMDGLDGLASGVSLFASLALACLALVGGVPQVTAVGLILAGSVLGFLRYNFYPARIFLGDSGSLFLGFALATLAVEASMNQAEITSLFVPVVALGLPIADTSLTMIRRLLGTLLPSAVHNGGKTHGGVRAIITPDKHHIHHQLLTNGFSHRTAVLILYGVALLLGVSAVVMYATHTTFGSSILILVMVGVLIGIHQLRYKELPVHRNGILLRAVEDFFSWPTLKRTRFQAATDAMFVVLSYALALQLTEYLGTNGPETTGGLPAVIAVSVAQVLAFWASGVYKETTRLMGIADASRVTRAAVMGTLALLTTFFVGFGSLPSLPFVLVAFFILHLFLIITRFAYSTLNYILHRNFEGKPKVVIYGANPVGLAVLELLLAGPDPSVEPVGFLDEDPSMEGKSMQGLPIYGGHRKLPRLRTLIGIDEVIVPTGSLQREMLERVKSLSDMHGVSLRQFMVNFETLA